MKIIVPLIVGAALLVGRTATLADVVRPQGTNTIEGRIGEGQRGVEFCSKATIYVYAALPEISPADGGVRTPVFEKPEPSDEHWETPCSTTGFTFKNIPDGSYLVGIPSQGSGPALATMVTVTGGMTISVVLTFQQPGT